MEKDKKGGIIGIIVTIVILILLVVFTNTDSENISIIENIEATPFFKAQIESLQVGLELFFHIAKVSLGKSGLSERTGSSRYNKCLDFSTNFLLLDLLLSSFPENDVKAFLSSWIV